MKSFIKIILHFVLLISTLQILGCASLNTITGGTEVAKRGAYIQVVSSKNKSPGEYALETTEGTTIAKASIKYSASNSFLQFIPDYTKVNSKIARSCLRIRTPENKYMPIGLSDKTKFKIPSLEMDAIRHHDIPELQRQISQFDHQQRKKKMAYQWLTSHPNLYDGYKCIRPNIGPMPNNACLSIPGAQNYCAISNFGCGFTGAVAEEITEWDKNTSLSQYGSLANILASNGCSIKYDSYKNKSFDLWTLLRANLITYLTQEVVESFLKENPNIDKKYLIAAIAGTINYQLCMNDKYNECTEARRKWRNRGNREYKVCINQKIIYDNSNHALSIHGKSKEELKYDLKKLEDRIKPSNYTKIKPLKILETYKRQFDRLSSGVTICH